MVVCIGKVNISCVIYHHVIWSINFGRYSRYIVAIKTCGSRSRYSRDDTCRIYFTNPVIMHFCNIYVPLIVRSYTNRIIQIRQGRLLIIPVISTESRSRKGIDNRNILAGRSLYRWCVGSGIRGSRRIRHNRAIAGVHLNYFIAIGGGGDGGWERSKRKVAIVSLIVACGCRIAKSIISTPI